MGDRQGVDTGGFGSSSGWSVGKIVGAIVGLGCLALIVLMATCVGGGALWWNKSTSSANAEVRPFLELLARGDFEQAYSEIADSWKNQTAYEKFRDDFAAVHERLGTLEDLTVRGLRIERSGSSSYREVTYLGTYTKGESVIRVRLEANEDGAERIAGVRFDFRFTDPDASPEAEPDSALELEGVTVIEGSDESDRDDTDEP